MANNIVEVTDMNFDQEVLQSNRPVVVDFWAPWCAPCRMLAPVFEQLANQYGDKIKFVKVNVDENPTSAIRFNIQWIPTVMIFKNWQPIQTIVGVRPPEEYQAIFNQILNENWWNNQETKSQKGNIIEINWTAEFNQTVENNKDKLLIVDFWAPWCGPCRMIAPVLEQIAKDFWDKVLIVKVNVDQPQNQMLAMQYQVSSIPHVEFIKWGMTVNRIIGAYPYEEFKKIVQQYV